MELTLKAMNASDPVMYSSIYQASQATFFRDVLSAGRPGPVNANTGTF
jgi:hypothetical protein